MKALVFVTAAYLCLLSLRIALAHPVAALFLVFGPYLFGLLTSALLTSASDWNDEVEAERRRRCQVRRGMAPRAVPHNGSATDPAPPA